jgi:hypothetical protein
MTLITNLLWWEGCLGKGVINFPYTLPDILEYLVRYPNFTLINRPLGNPVESPKDNPGYTPGSNFIDFPGDFPTNYTSDCQTDNRWNYCRENLLFQEDPEIALTMRRYKTYYAQAPLKKLLEYIYKKYPDYTTESEVIGKILK